ncbi:MAG: pyridoxal phosphate-dependent aminotransferase [Spartobacteria bacterium]|nr:pyridoxal phosphate-dependent aminotransferase [Spartobacteria bacterium]
MEFNKRIASVKPSLTLALTAKAKAMKAAGEDVCSFGAGEPDFDTPQHIKDAAVKALADGQTKYAPSPGLPALREAIAKKLEKENGMAYKPGQILVSDGAKHSLFNVIMTLCRDGDEVVIPAPFWLSYPEMVNMAGATPVVVQTEEAAGFKLTPEALEAAITPATRALILNSPSNPIGIVYTREELEALAVVLRRHEGVYVIADEIYEKILYDDAEHFSFGALAPDMMERVVTVNGFSKAYSMTGWRLGYFAADEKLVKAVNSLQSHSTSGAVTFAQYGALAALEGPQEVVADMVAAFAQRRRAIMDLIAAIPGVSAVTPMGAFYILPNISSTGLDSVEFAEKLLEEEKVAVVPGQPFGIDTHVRLSYACSMENIEKGLERMARFISKLS